LLLDQFTSSLCQGARTEHDFGVTVCLSCHIRSQLHVALPLQDSDDTLQSRCSGEMVLFGRAGAVGFLNFHRVEKRVGVHHLYRMSFVCVCACVCAYVSRETLQVREYKKKKLVTVLLHHSKKTSKQTNKQTRRSKIIRNMEHIYSSGPRIPLK